MRKHSHYIILMISAIISGCAPQNDSFTDVECLEQIGGFYYSNDILVDSIYGYCPIDLSDKKYYFSQIVSGGKSKAKVLPADVKSVCLDKWNSMLSRAWSASQKEIAKNNSLNVGVAQSNLILSAIFEDKLSTEALRDHAAAGNGGSNSPQCISPYNAVNIARELGISKLLRIGPNSLINENALTKAELRAAWLIVLHADIHPDIQKQYEPIFTELAKANLISGHNIALLSDRISIAKKEPLKYGVLYNCVDGKISHSLEDLDTVNVKRKAVNMRSYEDWLAKEIVKAKCE